MYCRAKSCYNTRKGNWYCPDHWDLEIEKRKKTIVKIGELILSIALAAVFLTSYQVILSCIFWVLSLITMFRFFNELQ